MGIDYYVCGVCGEPFPDVVDFGICGDCQGHLYEDCYEEMAKKYGELGAEHPDDVSGLHSENYALKCKACVDQRTIAELYVLANLGFAGNIVGYPTGGGSSTPSRVKAYTSLESAKRGKRQHDGVIIRITDAGCKVDGRTVNAFRSYCGGHLRVERDLHYRFVG